MSTPPPACRAHGPGLAPSALVGRRVVAVAAAWHEHEGRQDPIPVDVWLLDERGGTVRCESTGGELLLRAAPVTGAP